jgi:DNA-binding transcriptional MocR family regulator
MEIDWTNPCNNIQSISDNPTKAGMADWIPNLSERSAPRYLAIADAIAADIESGRLSPTDRLPPQRTLASVLGMDFTTVARGYVEAKRRGLIESRVGQGTFVSTTIRKRHAAMARHPEIVDLSMNLPPEPDDPDLLDRMQDGWEAVSRELVSLLRYQGFGGIASDKDAASAWLSRRGLVPQQDRVFITPGAHPALLGIMGLLAKPGDVVLSEAITYPGARSLAGQLGLKLAGLPMDEDGVDPDALEHACLRLSPKALYLNPTMLNPTTHTIPDYRRLRLTEIARRFALPIIEDDPYSLLSPEVPPAFAALAPELTWHVAGLAKCLGAGLRIAYVVAPDNRSGWSFAAALRAATVMASPITAALATRWISDGTGDALLAAVRRASVERQAIARQLLQGLTFRADPCGFHLWLTLPDRWTRSAFVGLMRDRGMGVVASDVFTVDGQPPEAVRMCLGGPSSEAQLREALAFTAHTLAESPSLASHFL